MAEAEVAEVEVVEVEEDEGVGVDEDGGVAEAEVIEEEAEVEVDAVEGALDITLQSGRITEDGSDNATERWWIRSILDMLHQYALPGNGRIPINCCSKSGAVSCSKTLVPSN